MRYISKYLVQYVAATPKTRSSDSTKRVSGARVLTSDQCVARLKEKEEQKRKEKEEKERRKLEREQKKKEGEEAKKKKAEERVMKAEERAKKAAESTKKLAMRSSLKRPSATRSTLPRKKSKQMSKTPDSQSSTLGAEASSSSSDATTEASSSSSDSTTSRSHGANIIGSSEINTNDCCICFRNFNVVELVISATRNAMAQVSTTESVPK